MRNVILNKRVCSKSSENVRIFKQNSGFTLFEMLVVIGIIALVSSVAVPAFKKSVDGVKINKTLDDIKVLMNGYRTYYLIFNEFPDDVVVAGKLKAKAAWAFPGNIIAKKIKDDKEEYLLAVKPYEGTGYDFENWFGYNLGFETYFAVGLTILGWRKNEEKLKFLKKYYPSEDIKCHGSDGIGFIFKEVDSKLIIEEKRSEYRNRYY